MSLCYKKKYIGLNKELKLNGVDFLIIENKYIISKLIMLIM